MKKILSLLLALLIIVSAFNFLALSSSAQVATTGEASNPLGLYCATNPNGQCGKNKTMTIDGKITDWDSSMLIAQGVCNDDPRVYMQSSMHELPLDTYALYAAWDDTNVYLMWEMKNVQDVVAPNEDYPLNPDNYQLYNSYGHNFPQFIVFNTGKRAPGNGIANNKKTVWDSGITWEHGIDTFIAASNQVTYMNGPYCYQTNDDGIFVYNDNVRNDIKFAGGQGTISTTCMGIWGGYGKSHNRTPGDIIDENADWVDYYQTITKDGKSKTHKQSMDFFFECSIPLSALGVTKSDIETKGIEVMHVETFGTSGMNSLPVDLSMSDNANVPYSVEGSTSHEKEDEDHITVPLAKIGVCNKPVPTEPSTEEPTSPGTKYLYGDVDLDDEVSIVDATMIQRNLAQLVAFNDLQKAVADTNKSGDVDILDALEIQKYLANLITNFPSGKYYYE